jgi:hypothetical protein
MPFDAAVSTTVSLHDRLAFLGIKPVPMAVLTEHKAAQEKLYPAHWLTKQWPYVTLFASHVLASEVLLNAALQHASWREVITASLFAWFIGMAMAMLTLVLIMSILSIANVRVFGKAEWLESVARSYHDPMLPPAISKVVRTVRRNVDGMLVLGELRRKEVVLDPYIVVEHNGERACLGIWIDHEVIACAEMF